MSSRGADEVSRLKGVGPVTRQRFVEKGLFTVQDVARVTDFSGFTHIPNMRQLVEKARDYMARLPSSPVLPPEKNPSAASGGPDGPGGPGGPGGQRTPPSLHTRYLVQDHSWWEQSVFIPCRNGGSLCRAVVYELSIESYERIAFICSWISTDDEGTENLCTVTYSPQLLLFFNPGLPKLTLQIYDQFWYGLRNKQTLCHTLWEINTMSKFAER